MSQNSQPRGWPALVGGGLLNVALGTYYAFSAFYPPLEKEFGWVRTQTSYISIINMVFLAIMFNVAGALIDRIGSRAIAVIGGLCFCLGMLFASFSSSLTMIYLSMALVGTGLGFGYLEYRDYIAACQYGNAMGAQRCTGAELNVYLSREETQRQILAAYGPRP